MSQVFAQPHRISREQRARALASQYIRANVPFRGCTIWFTGLSGAGKTTIAMAVEEYLISRGVSAFSLDGDNLRTGLNTNLGFSDSDREENIRRAAEVSSLFASAGMVCLTSFISPFTKDRNNARQIHEDKNSRFFEVYVNTPLEICEQRDPKGLYQNARSGKITRFTGIDSAYESPNSPDLNLPTQEIDVATCVQRVVALLVKANILPPSLLDEIPELFVSPELLQNMLAEAEQLPSLVINDVDLQWLQVLAEGWAYPLNGFMTEKQYLQSLHFGVIFHENCHGISNFPVPITLGVSNDDKSRLAGATAVALTHKSPHSQENKRIVAILQIAEFFQHRKEERCHRIFGTSQPDHPGVQMVLEGGDWLIGGAVQVLGRIKWNDGLDDYRLTPNELKKCFQKMRTDAIFAHQLVNKTAVFKNLASSIDEIQNKALNGKVSSKNPALLLYLTVNPRTVDNQAQEVQRLLKTDLSALKRSSTILAVCPSPLLQTGPREVQWHCRIALMTGATFYIVGRNPADEQNDDKLRCIADEAQMVLSFAPGLDAVTTLSIVNLMDENKTSQEIAS